MNKTRQIVDDFAGFTPAEMHQIIYYPFSKDCPIKVSQEIELSILKSSPFYNICKELLTKSNEIDGIKLTAKGNLPGKTIREIYSERFFIEQLIEDGYSSLKIETNWIILHTAHVVLKLGGLLRKNRNKLILTKKGRNFITSENESLFFYYLLETYSMKYNWAYNDGYPFEELGQIGFLFLLYQLNLAGNRFYPISKYCEQYLKAYPAFINQVQDNSYFDIDGLKSAFRLRFFERFLYWFGLINYENSEYKNFNNEDAKVKRSKLLESMFI